MAKKAKAAEAATVTVTELTTNKKEDVKMATKAKKEAAAVTVEETKAVPEVTAEVKATPKKTAAKKTVPVPVPEVEAKKEKAKSALNVMKELLENKATDKNIESVFTKIYTAKGKDADFTAKRIAIYKKIAEKEAKK
ncbi:MAG: hypothetical protein NT140_08950 [Deltaproteobacteria bacterium]|nr:hypothetical protein [Deltaproteobacteria bacterium]